MFHLARLLFVLAIVVAAYGLAYLTAFAAPVQVLLGLLLIRYTGRGLRNMRTSHGTARLADEIDCAEKGVLE